MSLHSFDPRIAAAVGLNAAVIYQNLFFWIEKNAANGHNFKDGRYWTYNSIAAFAKLFPYLTEKQIRTAIDKLLGANLIVKGNFSSDRYDRTAWYALTNHICPPGHIELPVRGNEAFAQMGEQTAPEGKSLENSYNPDRNPSFSRGGAPETADLEFDRVWLAYPEDRRRGKLACMQLFRQAIAAGASVDYIASAVRAYAQESAGYTRSKVSFSDNWFRQERWKAHAEALRAQSEAAAESLEGQIEQLAGWIKGQNYVCRHITTKQARAVLASGLVSQAEIERAGVRL